MLTGFSHVMMYVKDLDRAAAWYAEKLGFELVFKVPSHYASLHHPQLRCRIDLHPSEANERDVGFGPIPNFSTANIDDTIAQLRAKGVKSQDPQRQGPSPRFATFWDSEGNALGLVETAA